MEESTAPNDFWQAVLDCRDNLNFFIPQIVYPDPYAPLHHPIGHVASSLREFKGNSSRMAIQSAFDIAPVRISKKIPQIASTIQSIVRDGWDSEVDSDAPDDFHTLSRSVSSEKFYKQQEIR